MDRVCCNMPHNLHDFLYALAVIQEYQARLGKEAFEKKRDMFYTVTLRVPEQFQYLSPCFQVLQDSAPIIDFTGWDVQIRHEYDCFINFNPDMFERAKRLARPTKRHITDALGILIGSGPSLKYPLLQALQLSDIHPSSPNVIVLDMAPDDTCKLIQLDGIDCFAIDLKGKEAEDCILTITGASCVITWNRTYALLAIALGKSVITGFDDLDSYNLYNCTGRPNYHHFIGQPDPELIYRTWSSTFNPGQKHAKVP